MDSQESSPPPSNADRQQDAAAPKAVGRPLWWRILGLRRREGKRLPVGLTKWGLLLLVIVILLGMGGFAEYSVRPEFCRSCHIMEPYYQAWHTSTHKNVPCVDCHFEPGLEKTLYGKWQATSQAVKYLTATYGSKPHAEVRDASCLRVGCHETRLLQGKSEWTVHTDRGADVTVHFDHTPHLGELRRGKQLRCVSCHSQIVQGQHITVTLDTCFICHFKGLRHGRDEEVLGGCGSCHGAPKGQIRLATGMFDHAQFLDRGVACENCHADSVRGDGAVPRQQCWTCHNKPHQIARFGETAFIHDMHVTQHKVECSHCHIQIEHHLTAAAADRRETPIHLDATDTGTCGQCHEQTHTGPRTLYSGTGGRGVPDMPDVMFTAQVDCIACHQEHEFAENVAAVIGQTYIAAQSRCDYCHGNRYSERLDDWKAQISQDSQAAEQALGQARAALNAAALPTPQTLDLQRLLDDAAHNLRLVTLGHGVHNVTYSTALLNVALENAQNVIAQLADEKRQERPAAAP